MNTKNIIHLNPIWREKSNFIIGALCSNKEDPDTRVWEQLWSRQIETNRFEICCIPFFVKDLALGDEVETISDAEKQYAVNRVVKPSGHYTFRVWFGHSTEITERDVLLADLARLNCLIEWSSTNILAIDASSNKQAQEIADLLFEKEQLGYLLYETGRT